jgi:hypothetical protein
MKVSEVKIKDSTSDNSSRLVQDHLDSLDSISTTSSTMDDSLPDAGGDQLTLRSNGITSQ